MLTFLSAAAKEDKQEPAPEKPLRQSRSFVSQSSQTPLQFGIPQLSAAHSKHEANEVLAPDVKTEPKSEA